MGNAQVHSQQTYRCTICWRYLLGLSLLKRYAKVLTLSR